MKQSVQKIELFKLADLFLSSEQDVHKKHSDLTSLSNCAIWNTHTVKHQSGTRSHHEWCTLPHYDWCTPPPWVVHCTTMSSAPDLFMSGTLYTNHEWCTSPHHDATVPAVISRSKVSKLCTCAPLCWFWWVLIHRDHTQHSFMKHWKE